MIDKKIPPLTVRKFDAKEYFETGYGGKVLEPLPVPCHDCAVATGFYSEFTLLLSKLEPDFQAKIAADWDCHNACNRACRGNIDLLKQLNNHQ